MSQSPRLSDDQLNRLAADIEQRPEVASLIGYPVVAAAFLDLRDARRADLARPTPSQASASNPDIKKEDPQILLACADQAAITWAMGGKFDNRYHAEIVRRLQAPTSPAAPSTLETRARQLVEVYDKEDVYWAQLHIPEVERLRDALDRLPAPGEKEKE